MLLDKTIDISINIVHASDVHRGGKEGGRSDLLDYCKSLPEQVRLKGMEILKGKGTAMTCEERDGNTPERGFTDH